MKRYPAAFLFLCALLGAFIGDGFYDPYFFAVLAAISIGLLLLVHNNLFRIACLLFFTCFITAFVMSVKKVHFLTKVSLISKKETVFIGSITDINKKEDGNLVLLANVFDQKSPGDFNLLIYLRDALSTLDLSPGQQFLIKGKANPFLPPLSFVHFDAARFAFIKNLHGSISISNVNAFFAGKKGANSFFASLRFKFVKTVLSVITKREASLLLALMIGNTDLFNEEQKDIFNQIGAQHLLAVSGLQITLLAAIIFFLMTPIFAFLLPKTIFHRANVCSAFFTILITFWFIGLCGFSCSAVRAFLMTGCMLLPTIFARRVNIFDAFFVSGFLTILVSPVSALDLGFLLSYAAVLGLLVATVASKTILYKVKSFSLLASVIVALIINSMAAFLFTLPIIAIYFSKISPVSFLANFFLVPVASLLQIPAILLGLAGCLATMPFLIKTASVFANAIEIFASFLRDIFGLIIFLPELSLINLIIFACVPLIIFIAVLKKKFYLAIWVVLLLIFPIFELLKKPNCLEVTVIPVGQGDATLFSLKNGDHFLLDAGGNVNGQFDPGEKIIVPLLKKKGIDELRLLIISHPDPDHILGAFSLLENIKINEIWHNGQENHPLLKRLIASARSKKILVKGVKEILGSHDFGFTKVQVLAPMTFTDEPNFSELKTNDNSLVLRIIHGKNALLWPGDIEELAENLLLTSNLDISAQILKAPHHGSKTSSTKPFINAVNPKLVIYSTGRNNRFNFPSKQVVNRYQSKGISALNTATYGVITIKVGLDNFLIQSYLTPFKEKT